MLLAVLTSDCSFNMAFITDLRYFSYSRITDLTEQLQRVEDKSRAEREGLLDRLHGLTTESTAARLENQSLKVSVPL